MRRSSYPVIGSGEMSHVGVDMVGVQPPGSTFGQYKIREQIGRGGMGVVYRAHQPNLGREVAVKILSIFLASARDLKRFEYEARTAATLEHPNIVPIYDYGTVDNTSYVAMRLLTGGSLSHRINNGEGAHMPLSDTAQITLQLASALDYAHSKGIIHRDVKPTNILFDDHDVPYLVDFGIVKLLDNVEPMTSTNEVVGSLAFIAPEQLQRGKLTPAVDQYALGVTVYAMLTNHYPHEADSPYTLMNARLNDPATPLRTYRPDLPKNIAKIMERVLEKDPAKRYPNVSTFALALYEAASKHEKSRQAVLNPASIASRTLSKTYSTKAAAAASAAANEKQKPEPRKLPVGRVVAAVLLILMLLVGGWMVLQQTFGQAPNAAEMTATAEVCRIRLRSRAYIRSGPGTGFDEIRAYDSGWTTRVVGENTDEQGNRWWFVEVPSLNSSYWVADAVTDELGNCSSVPEIEG